MSRRYVAVRVGVAAIVLILDLAWVILSFRNVLQTGHPASADGAAVQLGIVAAAGLVVYIRWRIVSYLDETRPPLYGVTCDSCGYHAAIFDRRCPRCHARLTAD